MIRSCYTTLKPLFFRLLSLICIIVFVATQQAAAFSQNDYDCASTDLPGNPGGTCFYKPCPATDSSTTTGGATGGGSGGWVSTGATVDNFSGGTMASGYPTSYNGGNTFAELLLGGTNAGMRPNLGDILGHNGALPFGYSIDIRIGSHELDDVRKIDTGSGQAGDSHYKIDIELPAAQKLGWNLSSSGTVEVRNHATGSAPAPAPAPTDSTGGQGDCCPSASTDSTPASSGQLVWPFATKDSSQYTPASVKRVDQGWDIQDKPGATIYAIAPGTLHLSNPDPVGGFGNNYPTEELDQSIGGPSKFVYYGHVHMDASLEGKHVDAGQAIAKANTTDPENGSKAPPGWLEIGFANSTMGDPIASGSGPSAEGQKMKDLLQDAPPGTSAGPTSPTPGSTGGGATTCCPGSSTTIFGDGSLPAAVPKPYNGIFTAAANKFNISPAFLAAVFYGGEHGNSFPDPPPPYGHGSPWASSGVPSPGGQDWPSGPAGARGPFQFEYPTWQTNKVDGNGDGVEDPNDLADASFSAAKLLAALGAKNTTDEAKLRQAAADYNGVHDPNASYPSNVWAAFQKFGGGPPTGGSTGPSTTATPSCSGGGDVGNYKNPFRDIPDITPEGIDAGVDYTGHGPVYAIGEGTLVYINPNSGWQGGNAVAYRVKGGAADGKTIYVAEICAVNKALTVGDPVHADTVLCTLGGGTGLETGWATDGTMTPIPYTENCYYITNPSLPKTSTAYGVNFEALMRRLGAPKAGLLGGSITCKLPSGWPASW